jgi:hypothetical protein
MNPRIKALPPRARARLLADSARFKADTNKPPTRAQAKAWLAPIRKAFAEMLTGEVDAYRGYAITRIHHADNDFARIDHAANGFTALIERLMPDLDISPIKRVSKKLENGILLEAAEVHECLVLLKQCENRLIKFKRSELTDAANTEMVAIELERMGLKDAA